jgi:serine/threonine protein kinase
VLHRDIKPDNLLVETGSDTPRVRIIDLGCGCLHNNEVYSEFNGELFKFILALAI